MRRALRALIRFLAARMAEALALLLTAAILPAMTFKGAGSEEFAAAMGVSFVLAVLNARWISRHTPVDTERWLGRGIVMLEIDGLSYTVLLQPLEAGRLPNIKALLDSGSHAVSPYDCRLPS